MTSEQVVMELWRLVNLKLPKRRFIPSALAILARFQGRSALILLALCLSGCGWLLHRGQCGVCPKGTHCGPQGGEHGCVPDEPKRSYREQEAGL